LKLLNLKLMDITRQCIGIDSAKKDFVVTYAVSDQFQQIEHRATNKFLMKDAGFKPFIKWIKKYHNPSLPLIVVIEATGVYHEKLLALLHDLKYPIAVVHPKRAKDFSKTLEVKKVTDKIASRYLATMGLEKKLKLWEKPREIFRDMKVLTREQDQIQGKITMIKNEMEAEMYREAENRSTLKRLQAQLKLLKAQKAVVLKEIKDIINTDEELKKKIDDLTTIPGVGMQTAAIVVAETEGFSQVQNKRQLVSYCGLDVINQESGTSVKTKSRISKKGNRRIRKALHMPALTAIRHGENKAIFLRIVSKTGIKMKGVVAVQRKLLILMYTLWKNSSQFDPEYERKKEGDFTPPHELDLVRS